MTRLLTALAFVVAAMAATPSTTTPLTTASSGTTIEARYYYMADGVLHTWDFAANGTYLYTEVVSGGGFSGRSSERGTYSISGGILTVKPTKKTSGSVSAGGGMTGGSESAAGVRRYKVKLIGPGGHDGMILNGIQMKRKTW